MRKFCLLFLKLCQIFSVKFLYGEESADKAQLLLVTYLAFVYECPVAIVTKTHVEQKVEMGF